ncbi:hypothetical protein TWF506_000436 [Arthrobotrys conoides]|uniref:Uncharacterized protein n=1 Tax=Arthrobotrys conoides TaxID=74498 RepID=A0AAN8PQR7_9PEZI
MDPVDTERKVEPHSDSKELVDVLARLVHGTQQLRDEIHQKIIKLKLPKAALDNLNTHPSSHDTEITMASDNIATTSTIPPLPSIMDNQSSITDEKRMDILDHLMIRHIWATSKVRRKPWNTMSSVIGRPPGWILHLECKGYKSIGALFRIGMVKSPKLLRSTIWAALKIQPKYFDLSPAIKSDIERIEWRDVEKSLELLLSMTDTTATGPHALIFSPTGDKAQRGPAAPRASPGSPQPSPPTTPDQSSQSKKRKRRDPNTPLPPGETWLNMPEIGASNPATSPPDTQRSKLRKGRVRNMDYSGDLDSPSEFDEDDDPTTSRCEDGCEISSDESNDGSSSAEEYQQSESGQSGDDDGSIGDATSDSGADEEEDELPLSPRKRTTPLRFWDAREAQSSNEASQATSGETSQLGKTATETAGGIAEEGTVKEKSPHPKSLKKKTKKDKNGVEPKFAKPKTPIPSIPQASDPTQSAEFTSDKNDGTNQPLENDHTAPPQHSVDQQHSDKIGQLSTPPNQNMVYLSRGFEGEEILTECKVARNLMKYCYDNFKSVKEKVTKIVEDKHTQDQKLDILIQELAAVKESIKHLTNIINPLLGYIKGQES